LEISPSLSLLFEVPQSEVRTRLDELVSTQADIHFDQMERLGDAASVLIFNGLTFDCDFNPESVLKPERRKVFSTLGDDAICSALAISLHSHIEHGLVVPEIAEAFLNFGAVCARNLQASAVVWQPTGLQTDTGYFLEVVQSYVDGGVFPVLPIVDFIAEKPGYLRSKGLADFCGQEFELQSGQLDQQELIRRAIRLAHDLATNGSIDDSQEVADLDPANLIHLEPSDDGMLLHCRIASKSEQIEPLC